MCFSFADVGQLAFGRIGRIAAQFSVYFTAGGATVIFLVLLGTPCVFLLCSLYFLVISIAESSFPLLCDSFFGPVVDPFRSWALAVM